MFKWMRTTKRPAIEEDDGLEVEIIDDDGELH
jgi:hypothetical protein